MVNIRSYIQQQVVEEVFHLEICLFFTPIRFNEYLKRLAYNPPRTNTIFLGAPPIFTYPRPKFLNILLDRKLC